ncbi:MAG: hypothetical protein M3680_06975 [Myxococcota bacterium]|nr:hypothetical protein [Myxococcota bacterium]
MTLDEALALVREGRLDDARAATAMLSGAARRRLALAIAHARGDHAQALELAAWLWHASATDPTVLAVLVRGEHPTLRDAACDLLMRSASDVAYGTTPALRTLEATAGDLDAWRDVLAALIASGRDLEAVDGVAHALAERHADFALWALLVRLLVEHRHRPGLLAAIELAHHAFPHAAEARATTAMIWLGLGELDRAATELAAADRHGGDHPLIVAAHSAMADAVAASRARR